MGINGTFRMGGDDVTVIIDGNNIMFTDEQGAITTIEGLRIDYSGVIKEFEDLKDEKEWKKIAIERLKEKIKSIEGETNKLNYVKEELVKFGYISLYWQKWGSRAKKW